jgi:hypothetical protein
VFAEIIAAATDYETSIVPPAERRRSRASPRKRPHLPLGAHSGLAGPVDVGAVFDDGDGDKTMVIVYAVDHAIVAPVSAVQSL